MSAIPSHIAGAVARVMPSEEKISKLRDAAERLHKVTTRIENGKKLLSELEEEQRALEFKELPDLFEEAGTDVIGLPDAGVDLTVGNFYKAGIASDWEPERRAKGFRLLEESGDGGLVQLSITVSFSREEYELAQEFLQAMRQLPGANSREIAIQKAVHWQTLTSYVRERMEGDRPLKPEELEKLGATVGRRAKFKKRKAK